MKKKQANKSQVAIEPPALPQSREMKKSEERRPVFNQWLWDQVKKHGRIPVDVDFEDGNDLPSAIYGGANHAGVSSVTTRRWLREICAKTGNARRDIFVVRRDDVLGVDCVHFRDSANTGISAAMINTRK